MTRMRNNKLRGDRVLIIRLRKDYKILKKIKKFCNEIQFNVLLYYIEIQFLKLF